MREGPLNKSEPPRKIYYLLLYKSLVPEAPLCVFVAIFTQTIFDKLQVEDITLHKLSKNCIQQ